MRLGLRAFSVPKAEECDATNADAWGAGDFFQQVAIADGVSGMIGSRRWARRIVLRLASTTPEGLTRDGIEAWLRGAAPPYQRALEHWARRTRDSDASRWWLPIKAEVGSGATFLVFRMQAADGARPATARAIAAGDCCAILVREGVVVSMWPWPSESRKNPDIAGSRFGLTGFESTDLDLSVCDLVLLATDALARYLARARTLPSSVKSWSNEQFAVWVDGLRQAGEIEDDDTTMVLLSWGDESNLAGWDSPATLAGTWAAEDFDDNFGLGPEGPEALPPPPQPFSGERVVRSGSDAGAMCTSWPTLDQIQQALQHPGICFRNDRELATGEVTKNKLGLPHLMSGSFAAVCRVTCGTRTFAVRAFLKDVPERRGRYAAISDHLRRSRSPLFADFEYRDEGILIDGSWYPTVKMEWVAGPTLGDHVEELASRGDKAALRKLANDWLQLLEELERVQVAHGDLQHANEKVTSQGLRLIDYDGMFVPALVGQKSIEGGVPSFQHPKRLAGDFGPGLDAFAGLVITVALRALAVDPGLWNRFSTGDNLLLTEQDFGQPASSDAFRALRAAAQQDSELGGWLGELESWCAAPHFPTRGWRTRGDKVAALKKFREAVKQRADIEAVNAWESGGLDSFQPAAALRSEYLKAKQRIEEGARLTEAVADFLAALRRQDDGAAVRIWEDNELNRHPAASQHRPAYESAKKRLRQSPRKVKLAWLALAPVGLAALAFMVMFGGESQIGRARGGPPPVVEEAANRPLAVRLSPWAGQKRFLGRVETVDGSKPMELIVRPGAVDRSGRAQEVIVEVRGETGSSTPVVGRLDLVGGTLSLNSETKITVAEEPDGMLALVVAGTLGGKLWEQ